MRKGYNGRRGKRGKGWHKPAAAGLLFLFFCLVWIWKADMVKARYSRMKDLERIKSDLISENSRIGADLMEFKSLSSIDRAVGKRFGLTQNIPRRQIFDDPVKPGRFDRKSFVDMDQVVDWMERAVFRSGQINARERLDDEAEKK